jgi:hypothetical protein
LFRRWRLLPTLNARFKIFLSPAWRYEDRMIIMQCLVPTGSHRRAAPKQSLKQSKMWIFFWRDVSSQKRQKRHVPAWGMVSWTHIIAY